MADDPLIPRAQRLWAELTKVPVTFPDSGLTVVVSPGSWLCPSGWTGLVTLGAGALCTAPDLGRAGVLRNAFPDREVPSIADLRHRLPVVDFLGPAALAYCDGARFRPYRGTADVGMVPADHLATLLDHCPAADVEESGIAEITSPAFVVRSGPDVIAAAGYRVWPGSTAHLSVLTSPSHRGLGLARTTSAAAVGQALSAGLLPQWRARPPASRRTARSLGFVELGLQVSLDLPL